MSEKGKRISWIDCLKGFGIMLVVLGHILPQNSGLLVYIQSFHMPFFFIITGILHSMNGYWKDENLAKYVKIKLRNLIWPYITFSLLVLLYYSVTLNRMEIIEVIKDTMSLNGYKTLWFLTTLFFAEIIYFLLNKLRSNPIIWFIGLLVAIVGLQWGLIQLSGSIGIKFLIYKYINMLSRVLIAVTYITIGYYLEKGYHVFRQKLFYKRIIFVVGVGVLGIAGVFIAQINGLVNMHISQLNNILLYYMSAIFSSVCYIVLFREISCRQKLLEYLGRNSIIIMVTHYCIPLTTLIGQWLVDDCSIQNTHISTLLTWIFTMMIELIVVWIINRWFKFMIRIK